MEKRVNINIPILRKIGVLVPPALLIVLNIFLFGPFNIYKGNINEFSVSLASILGSYLVPAPSLFFILIAVGVILPVDLHRRYVSVLFVLGVLIWVQGNMLVWKYGLLNGQAIDWTRNLWRGWVDSVLWLILLGGSFFYYRKIYRVVILAGSLLILLQTANVAFDSYQKPRIWDQKALPDYNSLPPEICEFSSKQNVIQIVLDGFQSNVFQEIIQDDLPYYRNALEGFTFFRETTGSFPTTRLSVPAFLSGLNYRNNVPMTVFLLSVFQGPNIIRSLYEKGYDIDLIGAVGRVINRTDIASKAYEIPIPYNVSLHEYQKANSALMIDLVLFRVAPHFLKPFVYNNQSWLVQQLLEQEEYGMTFYGAHSRFLDDFIENMDAKRDSPIYKFIHLQNTHPPFVVGPDCEYAGRALLSTLENAKGQDRCALDQVIRLFEKLKEVGLYDNALIVLLADHGIGLGVEMIDSMPEQSKDTVSSVVVGGALPLLAIKPPQGRGLLKISEAPVMLTDIPATLSSILNLEAHFPGLSAFEINPVSDRKRKYYYYKWRHEHWQADFFERLDEYVIRGSVFDKASWRKNVTYFSPDISDYKIKKIDFGTAEADRFRRSGWGGNERSAGGDFSFNWALGNTASVYLSLPKDKTVFLSANIASYDSGESQEISIKVDGKDIGSWKIAIPWRLNRQTIAVPPNKDRPDVSTIEFVFSHHRMPKGEERPVAVMFESITLDKEKGPK